jgi:hypothetical protein
MSRIPLTVSPRALAVADTPALHEVAARKAAAPLEHAATAGRLMQRQVARTVSNGMLTAGLAPLFGDPEIWRESMQIQAAIMERLREQQDDLLKGCAILIDDYSQIHRANTISKLVEKQCNLLTQWSELLTVQSTNFMALLENIEVDYGYWASQRMHDR